MLIGDHGRRCLLGLLLFLIGRVAEASTSFLAEEDRENDQKIRTVQVHKVDAATKKVLISREIPWIGSMLSPDGTRLFATDGYGIHEFKTSDLSLRRELKLPIEDRQDYFFVHPRAESFYFTTTTGSMPDKVIVVQPTSQSVVKRLRAPHTVKGGFSFDPKRGWVYVNSSVPFAIDPTTHRIALVLDLKKLLQGPPFNLRQGTFSARGAKLFPLPNGTLLVHPHVEPVSSQFAPIPSMLLLYDPDRRALLRHSESPPILRASALSRDRARLFASTSTKVGAGAVIDAQTLTVLHTLTFPEPAKQFVPAPDGHGMWLVAESGKVYRLDDQTGQVLEQVDLPFRLRRVITPP